MSVVPAVILLPSVSSTLVASLRRKSERGEVVPPVWIRLVVRELSRCSLRVSSLSPRERDTAADLLDWYLACGGDCVDESWLVLYRDFERGSRMTSALLDYYASHVAELSPNELDAVVDVAEIFCADTGIFHDSWSAFYKR